MHWAAARPLAQGFPMLPAWPRALATAEQTRYGLCSGGLPKAAALIAWHPRPRPTPESHEQSDEGSHHSGEDYRLSPEPEPEAEP